MRRWIRMMERWFRRIIKPTHLKRTLAISLVVGVWLTAYNQYHVILAGEVSGRFLVQVFLNLLTPFLVSNAGLVSFEDEE